MTKTFKKCKKKKKNFFWFILLIFGQNRIFLTKSVLTSFFLNHCGKSKPPNKQTKKKTKKTEWIPSNTGLRRTHGCTDGQPCIYRTLLAKTGGLKSKVAF